MEGTKQPNQEKIRCSEKRTLRISEADTIKQMEMKEKFKKSVSGEWDIYSKPNYVVETSSKR